MGGAVVPLFLAGDTGKDVVGPREDAQTTYVGFRTALISYCNVVAIVTPGESAYCVVVVEGGEDET